MPEDIFMLMANGAPCSGYRCTLVANATGAATGAGGDMENTITVLAIAENGYNDHEYNTIVAVKAPVGNDLAAGNIDVTDAGGDALTSTGNGSSVATAFAYATAAGETSVNAVFDLTVLGDTAALNAFCAQDVAVKALNGSAIIPEDDESGDVCPGTRYSLSGTTAGQIYVITLTSEDGVDADYYLRVTNTPES